MGMVKSDEGGNDMIMIESVNYSEKIVVSSIEGATGTWLLLRTLPV